MPNLPSIDLQLCHLFTHLTEQKRNWWSPSSLRHPHSPGGTRFDMHCDTCHSFIDFTTHWGEGALHPFILPLYKAFRYTSLFHPLILQNLQIHLSISVIHFTKHLDTSHVCLHSPIYKTSIYVPSNLFILSFYQAFRYASLFQWFILLGTETHPISSLHSLILSGI